MPVIQIDQAKRRRLVLPLLLGLFIILGISSVRSAPKSMLPADTNTVLILHDSTGEFGWIGEINSILLGNLLGHFPLPWQAAHVEDYEAGDLNSYRMVFYLGTTFDNQLPEAFLEDVMSTSKTVCWMKYNLWKLGQGTPQQAAFEARFGFRFEFMDSTGFTNVLYKAETFSRHSADPELGRTTVLNTNIAVVPATAAQGSNSIPYILRGGNLWYVADVPFAYMSEEDRYLVFADLLHDIVGIDHSPSRRAIIRLEDIDPSYPPALLRAAADYLHSEGVPFAVATVPVYADPLGYYNDGEPERIEMSQAPEFVDALKYMIARGGQLVMHGYTHQYDSVTNPFTGVTGDDYEFFRVTYDAQTNLVDYSPVPEDSRQWAQGRVRAGLREFEHSRLSPVAWETPHYAASAIDYGVFAENFSLTIQRVLYFDSSGHPAGQFFPYIIERDSYGQKIMPENLGNVDPEQWYFYPPRLPQDLLRAARKNRVIRDGWASAFFHPYLDLAYLRELVQGVKALGYTYVPVSDTVAPTIISDPQSTNALIASAVSFRVEAVGSAPLSFQWRKNGAAIPGATNALLTLGNLRPSDAAAYAADVSNQYGSTASTSAQLIVKAAPLQISRATGVTLSFATAVGVAYFVEFKNSLSSTGWSVLTTVSGNNGVVVVNDPTPLEATRLYRLRAE